MAEEEETRRQRDFWGKDHDNIFRDEKWVGEYKNEERGGFFGIGDERQRVRYDEDGREVGYSRRERRGQILGFGGEDVDGHYDQNHNSTGYSRVEDRGGFLGLFTRSETIGYDDDGNEISSTQWQRRGGFLGIGEREVPVTTYRDRPRSGGSAGSYSSGGDSSLEEGLVKLVIGLAIVAFVIWLIFAVIIPLAIVNSALLALIAAAASTRRRGIILIVAILGALYVLLDYNNNGLTQSLTKTLPFLAGRTSAFVYLNVAAGLVAAFLLLLPVVVDHFPNEEGENPKQHFYLAGGLVLVGGVIGVTQFYADWRWQQAHPVIATVPMVPDQRATVMAPVSMPPPSPAAVAPPSRRPRPGEGIEKLPATSAGADIVPTPIPRRVRSDDSDIAAPSERRRVAAPAIPTISCVMPDGSERRLSTTACDAAGGMEYQ